MKIVCCLAVIAAVLSFTAFAADPPPGGPPKGTVCFAMTLRNTEQAHIACKGLGKFSSVAEIYEKGYRVVSSGVFPEAGVSTVFLIIEERK
jgi:hypothetical protein